MSDSKPAAFVVPPLVGGFSKEEVAALVLAAALVARPGGHTQSYRLVYMDMANELARRLTKDWR